MVISTVTDERMEYAFAIGEDTYVLSYGVDEDGIPVEMAASVNTKSYLMKDSTALLIDGNLYLTLTEMETWTGVTFALDEETKLYTVAFPMG
jgi:hypothetical protein